MTNYKIELGDVGVHEKTLSANVEDQVTIPYSWDRLEIVLHSATDAVYYTLSSLPAVVKGSGCLVLPAAAAIDDRRTRSGIVSGRTPLVRLITAGTAVYSVQYGG